MARIIRDYSDLRRPALEAGRVPSPWPVYFRIGGAAGGNGVASNTYTKNFSDDGYTYQLGELKVDMSPYPRCLVTLKKNGDSVLSHYGGVAFYWQPRSINSWQFTYPDSFSMTVAVGLGIRWTYGAYIAFYRL